MGFLDKFGFGSKSRSGDSAGKKSLKSNRKVDIDERFERLRTAVSGTMSKFYAARDRENDTVVGLKLCDLEKFTFFESRFRGLNKPSEGEISAQMVHPNIIRTLEYGLSTKNEPYLILEFIDGPGLNTLIHARDEERLAGKRMSLIHQMADALHYVHQQGFIHRDICPRNFICSTDIETIKLIDFGLSVPATEPFMRPGNRTGTPLYMAPEIVRRRATDQRMDIFAFGISIYQLLTFELPWPVGDASALAALNHDIAHPKSIFDYRPDLDKNLGAAIMRCIRANPQDRFPSMGDLVKTLSSIRSESAV